MKNNRGKLLLCISIFRTFASSMKMKNLRPHEVNEDEKFAPPREKFFSPTGEVKRTSEWAWMTFGLDKEDGSERCKTQEVRGKM